LDGEIQIDMEEEIIDELDQIKVDISPLNIALSWWEKMRLWFNLAMLATGIIALIIWADQFNFSDGVGVFFFGLFFNLLYSMGFLIDAAFIYYLKWNGMTNELRWTLFLLGTIVSCAFTFFGAHEYYLYI
jgi:hypothetical protein